MSDSKNQKTPKVLVYGHRGWIGAQFVNHMKAHSSKPSFVLGNSRYVLDYTRERTSTHDIQTHTPHTHTQSRRFTVSYEGTGRCSSNSCGDADRTYARCTQGVKYNTIDYLEQKGKLVENVRDNIRSSLGSDRARKGNSFHLLGHRLYLLLHQRSRGRRIQNPLYNFGSSYSVMKGHGSSHASF